jgi:purine nucleoside phosphorylase
MLVFIDVDSRRVPQSCGAEAQRDGGEGIVDTAETPFGPVNYEKLGAGEKTAIVLGRSPGVNPKALAYAARALGGMRVIGVVRDSGVERPSTPTDYIEFTSGRPTTFFETIGTGYVQQNPPYCPELHQTLSAVGVQETGNLLILDKLPSPNVRSWWQEHQVDLISTDSQPEGALCRELELCYVVLALPETAQLADLLPNILAHLLTDRNCGCDQLMATARKFGKLTADWFNSL